MSIGVPSVAYADEIGPDKAVALEGTVFGTAINLTSEDSLPE
jgi:hypothetical protein